MFQESAGQPVLNLRRKAFSPGSIALAISGAMIPGVAAAAESIELDKLKIEESVTPDTNPYAVPGSPYLAERVSDPRRTETLAETPQTITVLTGAEIADSGRSDLKEILDAQPGITLGTGENGNAFGDRYIIRGHEARSDIFVDGLRDPGMTIRESFATEQVEISKGPSSSFAGRGTTGGAVNSASKRASTEYDFNKATAGIGTDNHHRLTLDANRVINYDTAVRLNLLHAQEDIPDRGPADRERIGAAISLTHQATDNLEITADYYHFEGNDKPDLGTYIDRDSGEVIKNTPVYVQDEDFLESTVDTATLRLGYEIDPKTRIVNLTRYGTTDNGYVTTGVSAATGYQSEADALANANGFATATTSTHQGSQEVEYFANQLNLITTKELGQFDHDLVFGLEYTDQKVLNGTYDVSNTGAANCWSSGRRGVSENYCILDADGNAVSGINSLMQREISSDDWDSDWRIRTISLSAMDTVDLSENWTAFGGIRYDYYDYKLQTFNGTETTEYDHKDGLLNGHLGASYRITPKANIYASISTATNINGGESDVGTSCGYGGLCTADGADELGNPERTTSLELGTKWQLNDDKLLATASIFRITKDEVMENDNDTDYTVVGTVNTGKNRVEGIEFGLAGNLTDKLSAQAGIAFMEAEVLDSIDSDNVGKTLANFANNSASLHLKYQATPAFAFGGTTTYESERFVGQPDSAANTDLRVPDYTVVDAFASYKIDRDMVVRLNVGNLFNTDYYLAAYRSGSFTYLGDKRNAQLTLEYSF